MGCDLRWWSETRKDGQWHCDQKDTFIDDPKDGVGMDYLPGYRRDYRWFGLLADVRTGWGYSFQLKGIPEELSPEVKKIFDHWDCDGHSHSYLTRAELKGKLEELGHQRVELLLQAPANREMEVAQHLITRLTETLSQLSAAVPDTDQRIIFCFDN